MSSNVNLKERIETLSSYFTIRKVTMVSLILNLASISLGISYMSSPIYSIIMDIFGVILIVTLIGNLVLVNVTTNTINKTSKEGNRINLLCYIYLVYTILAMFLMIFGNMLISVTYLNELSSMFAGYTMVFCGYFGLLGLGLSIAYLNAKSLGNARLWDLSQDFERKQTRKASTTKKVLKKMLKLDCYFTLAFGIYFCYVLLNGNADYVSGVVGVFTSMFPTFAAIIFLTTTTILLKIKEKESNPRGYYGVTMIGLIISGIFFLPLFSVNITVWRAEASFSDAFGTDWKDKIPAAVDEAYFMQTPFSTPQNFLGLTPKDCIVLEHQLFFNGTIGTDTIQLYYDAFMPLNYGKGMPGQNSTLIRIHGGGWVFGDKGWGSMMQMNKYFAAQGYVVFDIQYALKRMDILEWDPLTPKYRKGEFTINEIVQSLGIFTKYLTNHSEEFGANLDSVFVSGGSAGGHLTCALALGIWSGLYESWFGSNLTIKGYIPFYPGNGLINHLVEDGGDPKIIDPPLLINASAPPCLNYQGEQDGLVKPATSQALKDAYTAAGTTKCSIIWLPFSGHANDIYFSGHYNQIFLYFMERFLYLCVNDLI